MSAVGRPGDGVDGGVLREVARVEIGVAAIGVDVVACEGVPDLDEAIAAAGGDAFAIGRPGDGVDIGGAVGIGVDVFDGGNVPDLHRILRTADGEILPVR